MILFEFNKKSNIDNWVLVDDGVMGGRSNGTFKLSSEGYGIFQGNISLENNGGFSSLRHQFEKVEISKFKRIKMLLKGDGKRYQLRLKSDANSWFTYTTYFETSGEWEEIEIELGSLIPTFRGRILNQPNFSDDHIELIGFLFGNKLNEKFKLEIKKIYLK